MQCILKVPRKGPFKWLSKQYKVTWDSPETHYIAFAWGKLEVNIGSYVVVEKPKSLDEEPKQQMQCLVAKVIELFDEGDGGTLETAYARVIWFSQTFKIRPDLRKQLVETGSTLRELVEDARPFGVNRIPVSSFVCKCFVILLDNDIFGTTVWDLNYNGVPLFYCRWRYDGNSLQPLARAEPPPPPVVAPRGRGRPRIHPLSAPRHTPPSQLKAVDPFCNLCNLSFHNFQMLADHIGQNHYNGEGPLVCPFCPDFTALTLAKLKSHLRNHTRSNYQCNVCKKQFKHYSHLRTHTVLHSDTQKQKVMKCAYCPFSSEKLIPMKRHMIMNHKGKFPYNCSICHKGFVLPSLLLRHKELCTIGNPGDDVDSEEYSEDSSIADVSTSLTSDIPHVEVSLDQLNEISSKIQETTPQQQPSTSGVLVKASTSTAPPPPAKGIFAMSQQAQETLASVLEEATSEQMAKPDAVQPSETSQPLASAAPEQTVQEIIALPDAIQQELPAPEQNKEGESDPGAEIQGTSQEVIGESQTLPSQDQPPMMIEEATEQMEVDEVEASAEPIAPVAQEEATIQEGEAVIQEPIDQEMVDISSEATQLPQEEVVEQEAQKEIVTQIADSEQVEWTEDSLKMGEEEIKEDTIVTTEEAKPMEVSEEISHQPQQEETQEEQREIIYFEGGEQSSSGGQDNIHKLILGGSELTAIDSGDGQLIIDSSQLALHQGGEESVIYLTQDELYAGAEGTQYIIIQPEMLQGAGQDDQTSVLVYNPATGTAEVSSQEPAESSNTPQEN